MNTSENPEISIVVPIYNEQDSLEPFCDALLPVLTQTDYRWELLLINDGSNDDSPAIIDALASQSSAIKAVHFSKNFGKEAALDAGLDLAQGDCIIFIDGDMQHPPECISQMLELWQQGYDVINAVKRKRAKESLLHRLMAKIFNRVMSNATKERFTGASDFKLIDRAVADALRLCHERERFFRGLVAWVGFNTTEILFDVAPRVAGQSKWNTRQLIGYSLNNIISFSTAPLVMVSWVGLFTVILGGILGVQTLYNYFSGNAVSGFTTVIMLLILLCGIILLSLGTISLYIAKIYQEQKARPVYIIANRRKPRV